MLFMHLLLFIAVVSPRDLNRLSEILADIAGNWELFLTSLEVSSSEQAKIKVQYANTPNVATHCLLTGLEGWVKSSDHPTYGDIIKALQGGLVTDKPLASRVERLALQKAHSRGEITAIISEVLGFACWSFNYTLYSVAIVIMCHN